MAEKKEISSKSQEKIFLTYAFVGGASGFALAALMRRRYALLSIIGFVLSGYIGYNYNEVNKRINVTKKKFNNYGSSEESEG